jgi:hypothetical protein
VYSGGVIRDSFGAFATIDYDGVNNKVSLGNVDIRRVKNAEVAGHDVLFGVAINNNPAFQNPWNSGVVPGRSWPYLFSSLEPQPITRVALDGVLSMRVLGVSVYSFIDDSLYIELAGYSPIDKDHLGDLGLYEKTDHQLDGTGFYARLAKEYTLQQASFTLGAMYFDADIEAPLGRPAYSVKDVAIDAFYQRERGLHNFTVGLNLLREDIETERGLAGGFATDVNVELDRYSFFATYLYDKTYGIAFGHKSITGSRDARYFQTANGDPDSKSYRAEVFWLPISRRPFKWNRWARMRLGLQYSFFTSFDGASNNYNGLDRHASDNNTLTAYWAFGF